MRVFTLVASVTLLSMTLFSQSNPIRGIGLLKLGTSDTSAVYEIRRTLSNYFLTEPIPVVEQVSDAEQYGVIELKGGSHERPDYDGLRDYLLVPGTRLFQVKQCDVAGVEIVDLKMLFNQNVLVFVQCLPTPELIEALRLKYGWPKQEDEVESKRWKRENLEAAFVPGYFRLSCIKEFTALTKKKRVLVEEREKSMKKAKMEKLKDF